MRARPGFLLALIALAACRPAAPPRGVAWAGDTLTMNTWSVVAVDPKTSDVGVAMASCVRGTLADALGALVPGKGAGATQAGFDIGKRNRVFAAIKEGLIGRRYSDSDIALILGANAVRVLTEIWRGG